MENSKRLNWFLCILWLSLWPQTAPADSAGETEYAGASRWSVHGYGTVSYVYDDAQHLGYRREILQLPTNLEDGTTTIDSRLGLQMAYRFNPRVEVVAQAVIRDQAFDSLSSTVEWAYIALRPAPAFTVRLGRVGADFLLLSDHRSLGYSQHSVRPNVEFYGFLPLYSIDGADLTFVGSNQAATWRVKSQFGRTAVTFPTTFGEPFEFDTDYAWALTVARETDNLRLKAGAASLQVANNAPTQDVDTALETVAAQGIPGVSAEAAEFAQALAIEGKRSRYYTIGGAYDDGRIVVQAELAAIRSQRDMLMNADVGYLQLGRRFDRILLFGSFSRFRPTNDAISPINDWSMIPDGNLLRDAAVYIQNAVRIDQGSVGVGLRWDMQHRLAVKFQVEKVTTRLNGFGLWSTLGARPSQAQDATVTSVGFDFVF